MRTNDRLNIWRCGTVAVALGLFPLFPLQTNAASDLLDIPARESRLASKSMLLAVANAGKRVVAVGERGIIICSDDEGKTWIQAKVPVSVTLTTVTFFSPKIGWAAGHDGLILSTVDGGISWQKRLDGIAGNNLIVADLSAKVNAAQEAVKNASINTKAAAMAELDAWQAALDDAKAGAEFGPSRPIFGLSFRNASEGLAIGAFGQLFQTIDSGKTWQSIGSRIANTEGLHYNAILRLADGILFISGEGGNLRRSKDDGNTWETLNTGYQGHLYGTLILPGGKSILTFGFAGNALRSDDDGKTWKALPRLTNKTLIGGVVLPDETVVLLANDRSQLLSYDQGRTFVLVKSQQGRPISATLPALLDGRDIFVAGIGGVSRVTIENTSR